jgi:predicted O-methyltransferase YrrM
VAAASNSEARLRALLGDELVEEHDDQAAADWADGYGVVSPDVARYVEVLREVPDAVLLAMRNLAASEGVELVDPETATLLALLARAHRPERVLEVGTGIGYLTLQLARAVPGDCTVTSIESDPVRQAQAHAFVERDHFDAATELRLGDPLRVLRERDARASWDMVVLGDPAMPRLELLDVIAGRLAPDALIAIPWALRGGRVADGYRAVDGEVPDIETQRTLNRYVAIDPRFTDVALLPVGDGLLLARRRD